MKQRIVFFDFAKGIAIISMIVAHNYGNADFLFKGIYSFHMPLFFIISGYFFRKKEQPVLYRNIGKRLLAPYAFSQGIVLVALLLPLIWNQQLHTFRQTIFPTALSALLGSSKNLDALQIGHCGPIWFLIALAAAMLIFNSIVESEHCGIFAIGIAFIGYATSQFIWLPFSLQPAMVAVAYLYIGYAMHEGNYLYQKIPWFLLGILFFCWALGAARGAIHISALVFPAGLFSAVASVCGSFLILKLSKLLPNIPIISPLIVYCGENSLCLLCMHFILKSVRHWAPYTGNLILNCILDVLIPLALTGMISLLPVIRNIFGLHKPKTGAKA